MPNPPTSLPQPTPMTSQPSQPSASAERTPSGYHMMEPTPWKYEHGETGIWILDRNDCKVAFVSLHAAAPVAIAETIIHCRNTYADLSAARARVGELEAALKAADHDLSEISFCVTPGGVQLGVRIARQNVQAALTGGDKAEGKR